MLGASDAVNFIAAQGNHAGKGLVPLCRHFERACACAPFQPIHFESLLHQFGRQGPRQVVSAFCPVETEFLRACLMRFANAQFTEKALSCRAKQHRITFFPQHVHREKPVCDQHAEPSSNMVIARAGKHCVCFGHPSIFCTVQMFGRRQVPQGFQYAGNISICNSMINIAAASKRRGKPHSLQVFEMCARSLRGHVGGTGQLFVGKGPPVHQFAKNAGAALISERCPKDV